MELRDCTTKLLQQRTFAVGLAGHKMSWGDDFKEAGVVRKACSESSDSGVACDFLAQLLIRMGWSITNEVFAKETPRGGTSQLGIHMKGRFRRAKEFSKVWTEVISPPPPPPPAPNFTKLWNTAAKLFGLVHFQSIGMYTATLKNTKHAS